MINAVVKTLDNTGIGDAISSVTTLSDAISKYGITVVIMSVFLVIIIGVIYLMMRFFIKSMEANKQNNDNLINQITDTNDRVINKILDNKQQNRTEIELTESQLNELNELQRLEREREESSTTEATQTEDGAFRPGAVLNKYINIEIIARALLTQAQEVTGCDRISVYVFHNGVKSAFGFPFYKMSCLFEVCSRQSDATKTIYIRSTAHKDMPLHIYLTLINAIQQNKRFMVHNVNEIKDINDGLDTFLKYSTTKSLYAYAIMNDRGDIGGFVLAEYERLQEFDETTEDFQTFESLIVSLSNQFKSIIFCLEGVDIEHINGNNRNNEN